MSQIINNDTGEIIDTTDNREQYALALKEFNALEILDKYIEARVNYLYAKEQLEMIEHPLKEKLEEIFNEYAIKSLKNEYLDATLRNGYTKKSWDNKALEKFIYQHGADPDDFKKETWVEGGITLKYKEDK